MNQDRGGRKDKTDDCHQNWEISSHWDRNPQRPRQEFLDDAICLRGQMHTWHAMRISRRSVFNGIENHESFQRNRIKVVVAFPISWMTSIRVAGMVWP